MEKEEIWKDIPNYNEIYQASNLGRIRSVRHYDKLNRLWEGKILTPQLDGRKNYLHVSLHHKPCQVHQLIAKTFIDNPNNYKEVNHKDENKQNNNVSNLEWCSRSYNNTYGSKSNSKKGENHHNCKLTKEQVIEIRNKYKNGIKQLALAESYGISKSQISSLITGRTWGWLNE